MFKETRTRPSHFSLSPGFVIYNVEDRMEDFRHLGRLADLQLDRWHEAAEAREQASLAPARPFPARRILLSLTVVLLGMVAWWGQ